VSDIFQEVDEEVRREQLLKLWERYQNYIVALVILILAGVGGWRGYQWWEARKSAQLGTAFEEAVKLGEQGKYDESEAAFGKIATEGTAGYGALARLREAAELASHDRKAALPLYERLASDKSLPQVMQDLAALRAGALLIDQNSFDIARARLEPLAAADRPLRHAAREMLALAAWRAGDSAAAKKWLDMILTDTQTPAATRNRVEMLSALVAADGKS
jgi:hypothetical protein